MFFSNSNNALTAGEFDKAIIEGKGYASPEDTRYETASGDKQEQAQKGFLEAAQGVIDACRDITRPKP